MTTKLTPKQKAFVDEYLIDTNASKAALRAGYSEKTAERMGSENLHKPLIKDAIANALQQRSKRTQIDADWVLKTLKEVWDADISQIINPETGALLAPQEWPEIWRKIVVGVDVEELYDGFGADRELIGQLKKLKILGGKQAILKMLGDHVNVRAFATNVKVEGQIELVDKVKHAQDRARSRMSVVENALQDDDSNN
jgi:phage terminase small subunit